jgi:tetratricopeptide (TPR) repeat protein
MATGKRVKKKNIKEDQLVTYAVRLSRWSQEHFNQVIISVVALVVIIAIAVFMANSRQSSSRQAEAQMSTAMSQFLSGDFSSANTTFQQLAERYGGATGARARYFQGESELRLGRYAEALASFDAYLDDWEAFPSFRDAAMIARAMCHEGLGNYQAAAEELVAVLGLMDPDDPRYLDASFRAGEFFAKAGDKERAAEYFQTVANSATGNLKDRATVAVSLLGK